ncbi:MAG: cytochrome d ubiquinol oxidase subunit II [Niabella sp.]
MTRNYKLLFIVLCIISLISGVLTSGISLVGRLGVNVFYKEYKFFKSWWQAALICLGLMLLITLLCYILDRTLKASVFKWTTFLLLFVCFAGLYLTYKNFRTDLSHRWLGERFHLGIYLYWIGFSIISLFFLFSTKSSKNSISNKNAP